MPSTATPDEIRSAYRAAARRHHPDAAGAGSAEAMAALNEAYHVLSDPGRRALYDASLRSRSSAPSVPFVAGGAEVGHDLDDPEGFVPILMSLWVLAYVVPGTLSAVLAGAVVGLRRTDLLRCAYLPVAKDQV